jgi:tetratricopeptide (TPR) repeat protein
MHQATLEQRESKLGPDHHDTLNSRNNLAKAYEALGRWADAEALRRNTLARRRKAEKPDSPVLASDLAGLGGNLLNQERWSESESLLREELAIRGTASPDDWRRFAAMSRLAEALLGQGRHAEAEPLVVAGYEGMKARESRIAVPERSGLLDAAERVIRLYESWGQLEQATTWKAKVGMPDLPAEVFASP